jgi:hypothetical protein
MARHPNAVGRLAKEIRACNRAPPARTRLEIGLHFSYFN